MGKPIEKIITAAAGTVLFIAAVEYFKKNPVSIEIIEQHPLDKLPIRVFCRNTKLAREHIEKHEKRYGKRYATKEPMDIHENPDVQRIIDMTDDEYDKIFTAIKKDSENWMINNGYNGKNGTIEVRRIKIRLKDGGVPEPYDIEKYMEKYRKGEI